MFVEKSFTIQMPGEVSLDALHFGIDALRSTLSSITNEMETPERPLLALESLSYGSAIVSVAAAFPSQQSAERFASQFRHTGHVARFSETDRVPAHLRTAARKLRTAARHSSEGIVLASDEEDIPISADLQKQAQEPESLQAPLKLNTESFGTLKGRLESLNSRSGIQFVVYDRLFDHAVRAKVDESRAEELRPLWGNEVSVTGIIRRDSTSGKPLSIVRVDSITQRLQPDDPYAWMDAEGILTAVLDGEKSETVIKKLRES